MSARPAGCDDTSGGGTSLVAAGFKVTAPAARRCSKNERMTESLNETVAALFLCERNWARHRSTSSGTTTAGASPDEAEEL